MQKLGSNWDTRGTPDDGGETSVEPGRWSKGRGGGRVRFIEGITTIGYVYICENTNVNLSTLFGEGGDGKRARGKPTKCCVHVCHYHYELHYDVRL